MTIVATNTDGLRQARRALDAGRPIVLSGRPPLAYLVAAKDAAVVNLAKGRPADQPAGMAIADFSLVAPHLALDADSVELARWLAADELVNLMVPIAAHAPRWMHSAATGGFLGVSLAWGEQTYSLLEEHERIFVSSANHTGGEVATTAAAANAAFDDQLLVIDGDRWRDPAAPSSSGTIIKITSHRTLDLVRHGIHDHQQHDSESYLRELVECWSQRS